MTKTETIRIASMTDDERTIISVLSPQERKEALLAAGQVKIQRANEAIVEEIVDTTEPSFATTFKGFTGVRN